MSQIVTLHVLTPALHVRCLLMLVLLTKSCAALYPSAKCVDTYCMSGSRKSSAEGLPARHNVDISHAAITGCVKAW